MSFTGNVKSEISTVKSTGLENTAELSAILYNIGQLDNNIKIMTENASVAKRVYNLVKDMYQINSKVTVRKGYNFNKGYIYILEINHKIQFILEDLGIIKNGIKLEIPSHYLVDDLETVKAYLRGVFMATGSISDPKKSRYHLELVVNNKEYAQFINELIDQFSLNSKILNRDNKYMIYIKESEKISDFLRVIGASGGVLYFEDIRIYRDHKNMTNRLNNCEQANVDKTIMTASDQIKDIEVIESIGGLDLIDDKVKEVAIYRKKYPEVSLIELSEIITIETGNKISKSGVYHRLNKIKDFANRIREKNQIN